MKLLAEIANIHFAHTQPFLIGRDGPLAFHDLAQAQVDISAVRAGDVVALIGDFDSVGIASLLSLLDRRAIVVPLVQGSAPDHGYFLQTASVQLVVENGRVTKTFESPRRHHLIDQLRQRGHAGVILFSSGTTGRPKAILHDFNTFLSRYRTPRPSLLTLSFLLFDHIGGINTLIHTLFNRGVVVTPSGRTPDLVVADIERFGVELLPTTPTFLRMLLLSDLLDAHKLRSLRVITYGTERMDQPSLDALTAALPSVDFRQTYGMSELGILRAKSRARNSLWMKIGGEGVNIRVVDGVLQIHAEHRMMGFLNAPSPFVDGWYDTGDLVEQDGEYLRVVGRTNEVINVGGLKILPGEIERVALMHEGVAHASAIGAPNPITGQHIEVLCEPRTSRRLDKADLKAHFTKHLPAHFVPQRIQIGAVPATHRFKRAAAQHDNSKR
jgi:acyl-CoA synthetase (AMP-forming)/AMP-acid ligase II